jgi:hypothetical protein
MTKKTRRKIDAGVGLGAETAREREVENPRPQLAPEAQPREAIGLVPGWV